MIKVITLFVALSSLQSFAMESAAVGTETKVANSKITVHVTTTDLGLKFGSIETISFEVDNSMTVAQLYSKIATEFFTLHIHLNVEFEDFTRGAFSATDERTLSQRGIKGTVRLKASHQY